MEKNCNFVWNMTDNKPKLDLGLLEEDDEFEEFPVEGKNNVNSTPKDIC